MGFNDRDYVRDERQGFTLHAPQTAVGLLLLANIGVFLVDLLVDGGLSARLALSSDLVERPWQAWQLLTYGFTHDHRTLTHILFNMIALWMFGVDMEGVYGKFEFLRIYLAAAVVGGLAWVLSVNFLRAGDGGLLVGASGAVTCIVTLFVLHYPRRVILLWGMIPVPVWLLGLVWIAQDILGFRHSVGGGAGGVAYEAHLGGALLAAAHYRFSWNFGRRLPRSFSWAGLAPVVRFGKRPRLKVHQPPDDAPPKSLDAEVDRILAKITNSGADSLSADERRTLERASSRYQRRRQ